MASNETLGDVYISTTKTIQKACHQQSIESGFWFIDSDGKAIRQDWEPRNNVAEKIALIHSELSEALEGLREDDTKNVAIELADTIIRVYDLAEFLHLDIGKAVIEKMRINSFRPHKHGKSF